MKVSFFLGQFADLNFGFYSSVSPGSSSLFSPRAWDSVRLNFPNLQGTLCHQTSRKITWEICRHFYLRSKTADNKFYSGKLRKMAKTSETFHDEITGDVYTIQGLNSDAFEPFEVLKDNKVIDSGENSVRRSEAILRKCLEV